MLGTPFTTRGDHRTLRDKLHSSGNVPRLQGAVARRGARGAMRLVWLVLLATAVFGQTYSASTFPGVWLPENPGHLRQPEPNRRRCRGCGRVFLSLPRWLHFRRRASEFLLWHRAA